jgi:polyisoprenoid-binding protein YceI
MRLPSLTAIVVLAGLVVASPSSAADYKIDPNHTHILFFVDHLGFAKMIGLFTNFTGGISFDPAKPEASKLNVAIKTASLQTHFPPRDSDLKGADWFNVKEFPQMTFVGSSFTKKDDKSGEIVGNLTLLGVTKPVTLEVTFNKAGRRGDGADTVGFSARGSLKRSDFGMKTDLGYIGDDVDLIIETEATR